MAIDLTKVCEQYKGLWVALKEEDKKTVVASGETLKETREKAKEAGYPDPIFFHVPNEIMPFIGGFHVFRRRLEWIQQGGKDANLADFVFDDRERH